MVWFPRSAARQPRASFSSNADSMGYRQSSEVTSTRAIVLTSSQEVFSGVNSISELFIVFLMLILNLISRRLRSRRLGVLYWTRATIKYFFLRLTASVKFAHTPER